MHQQRASSLGTSNRNQMMKHIQTLKDDIEAEQSKQWQMMKTIMKQTAEKNQKDIEQEREVFKRAASSVVHPFSHIAHKDTVYDYR